MRGWRRSTLPRSDMPDETGEIEQPQESMSVPSSETMPDQAGLRRELRPTRLLRAGVSK
jgi:hypothetical protein